MNAEPLDNSRLRTPVSPDKQSPSASGELMMFGDFPVGVSAGVQENNHYQPSTPNCSMDWPFNVPLASPSMPSPAYSDIFSGNIQMSSSSSSPMRRGMEHSSSADRLSKRKREQNNDNVDYSNAYNFAVPPSNETVMETTKPVKRNCHQEKVPMVSADVWSEAQRIDQLKGLSDIEKAQKYWKLVKPNNQVQPRSICNRCFSFKINHIQRIMTNIHKSCPQRSFIQMAQSRVERPGVLI